MKIIAFIPVRGGSKSIPLKNIKPLCGKPLVNWSIEALERCQLVDEIIVATDSDEIEAVVTREAFQKTKVYRRKPENAQDSSSTESVMLEYIHAEALDEDDTFMLVQATSPLTQTEHFNEALTMFGQMSFDSIISCVRSYRFYWSKNGNSLNYDYKNRPRRQDFEGTLMENGAFYINKVRNIKKYNNRLSGNIGVYEMPFYTATEIDEPDDWTILEQLMRKYVLNKGCSKSHNVKLFISDVDGTLTDAGMYYSENGDELKKFNTRDGMGFQLLREAGIKTAIITSEQTKIVANRARKLKIDYVRQSETFGGKVAAARAICDELGITMSEVAYIGDDINCHDLLISVGYAACPNDADNQIKTVPNISIMSKKGGEGCVREFISILLSTHL